MVGSIGGFNPTIFTASVALKRNTASNAPPSSPALKPGEKSAADVFMDYMKKSPAERMEDNWLKAHGLSKEKLAAMSPTEREAVMKQMKSEIEESLKQQTETKAKVDIIA